MSRDSTKKILGVALLLCLVCSVLVSVTAVALSDRQERNRIEEKRKNILQAAGLYEEGRPIDEQFSAVEPRIVDLRSGTFTTDIDPVGFDSRTATRDPQTRYLIPPERDRASIRARSHYMDVYLIMDNGVLQQLLLPVHGMGLWSTMYGFISLADDLTTVKGFTFYEHGETPGLGGEIDNPNWKQQWQGKKIYDVEGNIRFEVVRGRVNPSSPAAVHQVDGLAGATLTARGVSNLINYWLGADAFKPFIERLKEEGVTP
jgi:Na+-transporting NADH:ubiquinone oxidoreductase subunit C